MGGGGGGGGGGEEIMKAMGRKKRDELRCPCSTPHVCRPWTSPKISLSIYIKITAGFQQSPKIT